MFRWRPRLSSTSLRMLPTYSSLVRILAVMTVFDHLDLGGVGPARRIVDDDDGAIGQGDLVLHAGGGGDEVEVVLALEALLNDFAREKTEEAAAEAEAEGDGGLGLEGEAGVEAELSRVAKMPCCASRRVETGEDHGMMSSSREGFGAGAVDLGDGVADLFVSATFLMVATKKPTSPAVSSRISTGLGVMTPMESTSKRRSLDMTLIFMPLRSWRSMMRARTMTPW